MRVIAPKYERMPSPMPAHKIKVKKSTPSSFDLDPLTEDGKTPAGVGREGELEFEAGKDPAMLSEKEKIDMIKMLRERLADEHDRGDSHRQELDEKYADTLKAASEELASYQAALAGANAANEEMNDEIEAHREV